MRKVKFNIKGIAKMPKASKKNYGKIGRDFDRDFGGDFSVKKMVSFGLVGCAGACALALLSVFGGGFIPHTFSSVLGAFENMNEVSVVQDTPQITFDENLTFSYLKAPIQYAIPKAKIKNTLSFEIGNSEEDFKFKSITFTVGQDACNSIKRTSLLDEDSGEIYNGKCEKDKLKIDYLNRWITAGETVKFTLSVSLNDTAKIGQHLNFNINAPRDIEASIGFDDIYLSAVYPIKVSTIYVVGLQFPL